MNGMRFRLFKLVQASQLPIYVKYLDESAHSDSYFNFKSFDCDRLNFLQYRAECGERVGVSNNMRFSGCNGTRKKIALIGTIVFIHSILIYIVIYITVLSFENPKLFQKPNKQQRLGIKHNFPLHQLEPHDAGKLINITGFEYINNVIICQNSDVFLLILIPSAPGNKVKRDLIRTTWGRKVPEVKLVFALGYSEKTTIQFEIEVESRVHMDIVQGNFIDSFQNLTYKSVMSLKYVVYHCPQATYVLKVNDDSFVNMPLLLNFLKHDLSTSGGENVFLCNDMTRFPIIRETNSPWYIPEEDFAGEFFPSYCSGWCAIFTPDIAFKLYKASQTLKYIFIEDAFIYGIAAQKANVSHVDLSYFTFRNRKENLLFNGTYDDIPLLFGFPNMKTEDIRKFYEYFNKRPVQKSVHKLQGD